MDQPPQEPTRFPRCVSLRLLLTLFSYASLGGALVCWSVGQLWTALYLATASLLSLMSLLVFRGRLTRSIQIKPSHVVLPLVLALAAVMVVLPPGIYVVTSSGSYGLFRAIALALSGVAIAIAVIPRALGRAGCPLLLTLMAAAGVWMIRHSPEPYIDLYSHHQLACEAMLKGENPYSMTFPDIYGAGSPFTNPRMVKDGRTTYGFAYPPTSLYASLPSYLLLGDYRYGYLACLLVGAGFLSQCASRWHGAVAAVLLLLAPRMLHVLESGWTEMPLFAALGIFVFMASRGSPWAVIPLAAMLASKQYMVCGAPLLILLLPRPLQLRSSLRFLGIAAATVLVIHGPWLLLDPGAYFHSLVRAHTFTVFRADSMSWMSALGKDGEAPWPNNFALIASIVVAAVFARWAKPDAFGFCTGLAATLLTFFLLTRGFTNYFMMVAALIAAAFAIVERSAKDSPHPVVENQ